MPGKPYLAGDTELGKKDDDYWQRIRDTRKMRWLDTWGTRGGSRWRWRKRRRFLFLAWVGIVGGVFLVLRWSSAWGQSKSIMDGRIGLEEDLREAVLYGQPTYERSTYGKAIQDVSIHEDKKKVNSDNERNYKTQNSIYDHDMDDKEPTGPPPGMEHSQDGESIARTYSGPIRFFRLAHTLRAAASHTSGFEERNRNVVFVMATLQSAAALLPMICDMSKQNRNHVHGVFMGWQDLVLEDVLHINGIDKEECRAMWHDARPNYTEYSNDDRTERAAMAAMAHVHSFLHPQVVIMVDELSEHAPHVRGIRNETALLKIPLIEVPEDRLNDLDYLTRLDSSSLKKWHKPRVDIIIQVPPDSSSVLGLLKSIRDADYSGLVRPRITLELPASLDISVRQQIESFTWSSHSDKSTNPVDSVRLILRRRIADLEATQDDAVKRILELFYPANSDSHVLLLAPQAQLAPQYFHLVTYALLEHYYSTYSKDENEVLAGVSLGVPTTLLDGRTPLIQPQLGDMHTMQYARDFPSTPNVPFLWQGLDFAATLLWGDRWAEWHEFMRNRMHKSEQQKYGKKNSPKNEKPSKGRQGWREPMEEFMRVRGYAMLYPINKDKPLVTVHEMRPDRRPRLQAPLHIERIPLPASMALQNMLPFSGELPDLQYLPFLLHNGTLVPHDHVANAAISYADTFRKEVGGCEAKQQMGSRASNGDTRDLFCFEEDEL